MHPPEPATSEFLLSQISTSSFLLSYIYPLSHVQPSWLSNVLNALLICITINFHQNLIKIIVINYLLKFFQLSSLSLPYLFKIFIKHAYVGYPALLFFPTFFFVFISMDSSSSHQTQTTLHLPIIYKSLLQPYSKSLTLFLSALPLPIVCFNCCPL